MSKKTGKEIILDIIAVGSIILNFYLLLEMSKNVWAFIIAFMFGAPLFLNAGNAILAKQICKKFKLDPLILLLFHLVAEVLAAFIVILINLIRNNGRFIVCADSCSTESFPSMLLYLFVFPQIFYIGSYICYIVIHFINRKKIISQPGQNQTPNQV